MKFLKNDHFSCNDIASLTSVELNCPFVMIQMSTPRMTTLGSHLCIILVQNGTLFQRVFTLIAAKIEFNLIACHKYFKQF